MYRVPADFPEVGRKASHSGIPPSAWEASDRHRRSRKITAPGIRTTSARWTDGPDPIRKTPSRKLTIPWPPSVSRPAAAQLLTHRLQTAESQSADTRSEKTHPARTEKAPDRPREPAVWSPSPAKSIPAEK